MTSYWIGVVSKQHVERGKAGGFAQICHGKGGPLKRMRGGDVLIYYSPQLIFGEKGPCQCFTALGVVSEKQPYQFEMSPDFIPFRRDVDYFNVKDAPIRPLIPSLNFIKDKQRWGVHFVMVC